MKKIIFLLFMIGSMITCNSYAFDCKTTTTAIGQGGGSADVYVTLTPEVKPYQNLVVNLSNQISCKNEKPERYVDIVSLKNGSSYQGALLNFNGTIVFNGSNYPFPLMGETSNNLTYSSSNYIPFPVALYLSPKSYAAGVVVAKNSHIATLNMRQKNYCPSDPGAQDCNHDFIYSWRIFSANDVIVPTGGCEVRVPDIKLYLASFQEGKDTSQTAYIAVRCPSGYKALSYYISGATVPGSNVIFKNIHTNNPAQGMGMLFKVDGVPLQNGVSQPYGFIGDYYIYKNVVVSYEPIPGATVTAGNIMSQVFINFKYD